MTDTPTRPARPGDAPAHVDGASPREPVWHRVRAVIAPPAPPGGGRASTLRRRLPVPAAAAVLITFIVLPNTLDNYPLLTIARVAALGLLAASTALLTGTAGLPSLGQVAPYAVGAYTAGLLARIGTVGIVQILVAAAAAAVFALVTGLAVVRTRGTVCLMVTLAMGELTAIAADQWKSVTGGTDGMARVPAVRAFWGAEPMLKGVPLYWYAVGTGLVVLTVTWLVLRTRVGALVRGCRDNEERMRASGHRVSLILLLTHVWAGAIAGVGGALLIAVQRFVSPADVGFEVSALTLLAVVIGGAASLWGAVAGAGAVVAVRDNLAPAGQAPLLLGALFIAAVYLLPRGLAGIGRRRA